MAPETAHTALEALWACLVECVEAGHEKVVAAQAAPGPQYAADVESIATDLSALSHAALRLAKYCEVQS